MWWLTYGERHLRSRRTSFLITLYEAELVPSLLCMQIHVIQKYMHTVIM